MTTNHGIKFDRVLGMSCVPTLQSEVNFYSFQTSKTEVSQVNKPYFLVLDVMDKMSSNCIFERPEIEVGGFHCAYSGDLILKCSMER